MFFETVVPEGFPAAQMIIASCFIKIQNGLTFLLPAYTHVVTEKEVVKWVSVFFSCGEKYAVRFGSPT